MDSLFAHHAVAGRCIVCVFGAPACGKTTLIARLEREMRDAGGVRVKAIKFDDLMQAELARLDEVRSASSEDEVSGVDVFSRRAWRAARAAPASSLRRGPAARACGAEGGCRQSRGSHPQTYGLRAFKGPRGGA